METPQDYDRLFVQARLERAPEPGPAPVLIGAHDEIRQTNLPCILHKHHIPTPRVNHEHHVWPLGDGGPNIPENKIVVCPTGHYNIHALLDQLRRHRGEPPYTVLSMFAVKERAYAKLGYQRITRKSM
jgi:hypothetical protein